MRKRLLLFVEGEGDASAVPRLVRRLLTEQEAWGQLLLDKDAFRVGAVNKLAKGNFREWKRKLEAASHGANATAVLLLLDGDIKVPGKAFCAFEQAKALATAAREVGAGKTFSVAIVFARQEYETWLLAGAESLAGRSLPDGRVIANDARAPEGDLEEKQRNAKGWLRRFVPRYKPALDQAELSDMVDLAMIRERQLRSFQRMENALKELHEAVRTGDNIATPA